MMWRPLCVLLWLASARAALLHVDSDPSRQHVLNDAETAKSHQGTKVASPNAQLPTVDLGYTRHKAIYNINPNLYHFQSIRYAAPPTGPLRFKAPQPPIQAPPDTVEDGRGRKECPQATIKWGENFPDDDYDDPDCCQKEKEDGSCETPCDKKDPKPKPGHQKFLGGLLPKNLTDPKFYGEDCLHLDVWAPKDFWDPPKEGQEFVPHPVVVWIYGGAYIFGGKSLYFPGGLIARHKTIFEEGVVFVSMNYRMGALGFAAGKDIADADLNAGLLDQRQALKWVKEHISKFGGDPEYVTLAGLSAGGGSVIHHLTAYGGEGEKLFRRAVSLSGGWQPVVNKTRAENTFQDFMKTYNKVSTIDELRKVSEEQIMKANYEQIYKSPPGTFTYNPIGWGDFAPKSPSKLSGEGKIRHDVDIMLSHVGDEGSKFAKAFAEKGTTLAEFVDFALPDLDEEEREWVMDTYAGQPKDEKPAAQAIGEIIGDATFRCPVTYVSDARYGYVFRHQWNVTRSRAHGGDLLYLFYQPGVPVSSLRSALLLQDYVLTFASYGSPATLVENPKGIDNPVRYGVSTDQKEQYIGSYTPIPYPKVYRSTDRLDYLCRVWQQLGST